MPVTEHNDSSCWKPSCSLDAIKARAEMYISLRAFFYERHILEVETPLLSQSTATDPFLDSIPASVKVAHGVDSRSYYLHTSPEFPMKRLLASGSGPIYQLCKTFRNAEVGERHNPEFTMLEWYRPGFDMSQLMHEVEELVARLLNKPSKSPKKISYRDVFLTYLNVDPFLISDSDLEALALEKTGYSEVSQNGFGINRDNYLNVLLSICIEPFLGKDEDGQVNSVFLYGYPPSQASLAKLRCDEYGQQVAERFELYINGLEIANGYFELTDSKEQRRRFQIDNRQREELGLSNIPLDENLLRALEEGIPNCSGVALGIDRLLMIKLETSSIEDVISFPITRA